MVPIPDIMIRLASALDASMLAELGARTFSETFSADNTAEDMAAYVGSSFSVAAQAAELADPHTTFLIAEIDGVALGYAKLHAGQPAAGVEGDNSIELVRLYVSREWHGRGVAQTLMRACLDHAKGAGHETMWLGVWEQNERAKAFYRKWDFRAVGEHVFQLGSDAQRDIVMERVI
jgi:ribosomal protein S18 acetylase RimI-like enzyme